MSNSAEIDRSGGEGFGMFFRVTDKTPDFRKELGFGPQSGFTNSALRASWTFNQDGRITQIRPSIALTGTLERNGERYARAAGGLSVTVNRIHGFWLDGSVDDRREGVPSDLCDADDDDDDLSGLCTDDDDDTLPDFSEVTGWSAAGGWWGEFGASFAANAHASVYRGMDFGALLPAHGGSASIGATIRPASNLRIDTSVRHVQFWPQDGEPLLDTLGRVEVKWQLSRALGLRVIEEASHVTGSDPHLLSSVLVTWLLHPFTAAYVGYTEDTTFGDAVGATERSVFAKVHLWMRP